MPATEFPEGEAAPGKRSKLKLVLLAAVPLLLAGGGYVGWMQFMAAPAEAAGHGEAATGEHGRDAMLVASVPSEAEAQTSATHSYALSVLLEQRCGAFRVPALKAASDDEARADGLLASMSWAAATRRLEALTEKSCTMLTSEVLNAEVRARELAEAKAAAEKGGKAGH